MVSVARLAEHMTVDQVVAPYSGVQHPGRVDSVQVRRRSLQAGPLPTPYMWGKTAENHGR